MRDETLLYICAIICITILEVVNIIYMKIDGNILSAVVGAIVYLATRTYYIQRYVRARRNQ